MFDRVLPHQVPPTRKPDVHQMAAGGVVRLVNYETVVTTAGDVRVVDGYPGARKLVRAKVGDVVVTGANVREESRLKEPNSWALLEFDGFSWFELYTSRRGS
ncbi:MAG: hypothetical protein AAFX75_14580 [Pseudomonadota bacterium]